MTKLIQDVKKDFPEFWDLSITNGNNNYYDKAGYDITNISLIFEHLNDDKGNNSLLIVHPNDPAVGFISLIQGLFCLLKRDLLLENSSVISNIKIGDSVALIDSGSIRPGIYLGIEKGHDGIFRHLVKEDMKTISPVTHGIPFDLQWTIQPYKHAKSLKKRRQGVLYGEKLEKLLGLPPGGLLAFQKSKMLYVARNKVQIKEIITDISLEGDPLTSVFSIADCVSEGYFNHLGKDPLRREPTCALISNTDIAVDVALGDPSVKLIVIEGSSKITSHYGSLERLSNDSEQCKVICLLNAEDENEIKMLKKMGAKAWIWKRQDFQDLTSSDTAVNTDDIFIQHKNILNHLSGPDPKYSIVEQSPIMQVSVDDSFKLVSKISRVVGEDVECAILLRWTVSIINNLLQLPLPLKEYHDYIDTLNESGYLQLDTKLHTLQNKVRGSYGFSVPSDTKNLWEELFNKLWLIYRAVEESNPKWLGLTKLISTEAEKYSLVCVNDDYANALKTLYGSRFQKILSTAELGKTTENKVIITGWKDRRTAAKLFLAPNKDCVYLLYSQENQRYLSTLQTHPSSPESNADISLRDIQDINPKDKIADIPSGDPELENMFAELDRKFTNALYKTQLQDYGDENMTEAHRIIFEENMYTYITGKQPLNKLDRESRTIHRCRFPDIRPDDELIFAESERDLFEELLLIIKQSDHYKDLFTDTRRWHEVLINYMTKNNIDDQALIRRFLNTGCSAGEITIKSWIKGDLISPSEDHLRDMVKVISDPLFSGSLERIINASRKIHSLHIQTGRLLIRRIVNAAVHDEKTDIDDETKRKIEEYSRKARIVTVKEISTDNVSVPAKATGRLFEF